MSEEHKCHHPTCEKHIARPMFACAHHWFALPARLRSALMKVYRPGQEVDKQPSREYMDAAQACLNYWRSKLP